MHLFFLPHILSEITSPLLTNSDYCSDENIIQKDFTCTKGPSPFLPFKTALLKGSFLNKNDISYFKTV